jgi:UDP-galactopyranose mutase
MARFAQNREVFFVEEPVFGGDLSPERARLELRESDGVTVCHPVCRDPGPGGGPALDDMYTRLAAELVATHHLEAYTAWFYTPMLLPAAGSLEPALLVYDAMDELSLFKGAPPELLPRERQLLQRADVVFTGGVSLGRAKAALHRNVHAIPSGVDLEHYRQALEPALPLPADLAALPHPRVGFFGVIDERADLPLLAELARRRPQWQVVMIGPVLKIDSAELPQAPNLHYLGQKPYRDLPGYTKGFDVCMLPFALNEATRFISPTKTLEYMAAHKPIVSTPVADVVGSYRDHVAIAADAAGFVTAVERALNETPAEREQRIARERTILARSTWDSIVVRMDALMQEAAAARASGAAHPIQPAASSTAI